MPSEVEVLADHDGRVARRRRGPPARSPAPTRASGPRRTSARRWRRGRCRPAAPAWSAGRSAAGGPTPGARRWPGAGRRSRPTLRAPSSLAARRTWATTAAWPRWTPSKAPMVMTERLPGHGGTLRSLMTCTAGHAIRSTPARPRAWRTRHRRHGARTRPGDAPSGPITAQGAGPRTREYPPVRDQPCGDIVDLDTGVVAQRLGRREQYGDVGRRGIGLGERADRGPSQPAQVRAAAEQVTEVGRERPDVRARRALDLDAVHERLVRRIDVESVDDDRPRLPAPPRRPPGPARGGDARPPSGPTPSAAPAGSGRSGGRRRRLARRRASPRPCRAGPRPPRRRRACSSPPRARPHRCRSSADR